MSSSGPSPQTPAANLVANPGGPYNTVVGQAITFDGSKSTAPPGQALTYFWDFGDNSTGTGVSPTHTYSTAGTFTVSLTVTDSSGATNTATTTTTAIPGGGGELGAPTIFSFTPQGGPIGTVVTIQGQNFSATPSNDTVQFNGIAATVTAATEHSLTVTVPPGATTGPILVSVGSLMTISPTYFTVLPATITQLVPNSGLAGQTLSVAVTGQYTHFVNGTTTADFGGGITVNSVSVTSATAATVSITISPTAAPGGRTVTLTTGSEAACITGGFTVVGSLTIQTTSLPDGQQGVPYSASVLVSGGTQPYTWAITSGALPTGVTLNTSTGVISGTPSVSGTFTITVGVNDSSSPVQTKSASYTFTLVGVAVITGASPASGHQADTSDSITLTGQFTHFVQGQTSVSFGSSDVTVIPGSVTVNSATSVTVSISIATTALIGARNVTVTTGSEVAVGNSVFTVLAGVPAVSLSPNFGVQGTNPTITITGTFTHFTQGQTTANFGGSDITAGAVTVNSPTQATVQIQISIAASLGQRTIFINTGSESAAGTFTVTAGTPVVVSVNPNVGGQNVASLNVTVNANFTSWANQTTVASFGPGISVGGGPVGGFGPVTVANSGQFTASISIAASAVLGPRTITVQTGSEQEIAAGAFTVENCTTTAASALYTSPFSGAGDVPLNTQVQWEFNAPLGRSTINTTSVYLYDTSTGLHVPSTVTIDAAGRIVTLAPSQLLGVGRTFYGYLGYGAAITDACGNALNAFTTFTTTFAPETSGPSVIQTSPSNNDTVPLNAQVVLQFSVPINPLTLQNGFTVSTGGAAIPGTYAPMFTNDYTRIVFTPGTALTASAAYTVNYTAQLTDVVGNALVNPGSFSFTAGTAADTTHGSVTATNPQYAETGIGTNVAPTFYLNKILDPISVETANSYIYDANTGKLFASTVTVSADRLSATITPSEALQPGTTYYLQLCAGPNCYDLAGNYFNSSFLYFTTAGSAIMTGPTVTQISPPNGATGAPVNTRVVAVMSGLIDPNTVGNSVITVTPQGSTTPVTGTVTLASDQVTLTWVPSASLATSTTYHVAVGGFSGVQGNAAAPFSSSFNTGTNVTPVGPGSLTAIAVTPANGATNVSNMAPVVITFSEAVNPATLNNILVRDGTAGYYNLAGTWAVTGANGAQVTFTPAQPYPANAQIQVWTQDLVQDLAGNTDTAYVVTTFTVGNTADTTAPTVTSVTPTSGATGIGRNASVVLTFSESINPATVNGNSIGLFAGITPISASYTMSANNRTVIITSTWPPATTITVVASQKVQDFSGNSLVPFQSQFATAADFSTTQPRVVTQRPGSGATDVPPNAVITLFTNGKPLNPSTVGANSLRVSHNGVLIDGTISVSGNNQAIEFTPSQNFNYGDLVQIFLDATIQDVDGNALVAYNGQFTVAGNPVSVAPKVVATNPPYGATSVPLNAVVQVEFDQALASSTINGTNVLLCPNSCATPAPGTVSLIGANSNIVQFIPSSPLNSTTYYYLYLTNVTNAQGVALSNTFYTYFQTGTAADTTAPTVVSVSPLNGTSTAGVNAFVLVKFSKAIDPISVTGSTIQISYGSQPTLVPPVSLTFGSYAVASPYVDFVEVTPQSPLPANTLITVTINGVTDMRGNALSPSQQTSQFTTGPGPDTTAASVVFVNPDYGASNVPTNTAIVVQFNKQMDTSTICDAPCGSTFLSDGVTGLHVPGTLTFSTDLTSFTFVPSAPLLVNRTYYVYVDSALDLTGNPQSNFFSYFTTSFATSSTIPAVVNTNPENTLTGVPVNTVIEVLFNEPVRPETITNVTLLQGGTPVSATPSLSQGDMLVSLTPNALLLPNAPYTISVSGVQDFAGHTQSGSFSSTFTTGPAYDLVNGNVTATDPTYGQTGVGTNTLIRVFFSKRINPISLQLAAPTIYTNDTGRYLPISLTLIAADRLSATFTPGIPLQPFTTYWFNLPTIYDVAGNYVSGISLYFTTGAGAITTRPSVSSISPPNGTPGTPVNTRVVVVMSAPIDPTSVNNSSITVMPNGSSAPVPATVTVASDLVTLTWAPTSNLATSTTYNVSVSGFQDSEGNPVIPFTSSFTTGTSATPVGAGSLTAVSVTPVNNATNVSNTAQIVITFSEAVNPATINNILVRDASANYYNLAGTWAVTGANGAQVTFTPAQPYPANAQIQVWTQDLVQDLAGNTDTAYVVTTFTVGSTPDTTAPTVISVSPANGTTNVGRDVKVVLTFSKSVNPATISGSTIQMLAGDTAINPGGVISADNRTFSFNTSNLAASTTYTVVATSQVQDFSGNALQYFQSQFTTGPLISPTGPRVVTQRPANGATDVPANTVITLYTNGAPLNPSTVTSNSLHVSQNGVLVSGSITLSGNNQAIEFTPSSNLNPGAVATIYMDQTVTDVNSVPLTGVYSGQFTVAGNPASVAPQLIATNPPVAATSVPLNPVVQVAFDQALLSSTINSTNVYLYNGTDGTHAAGTASLIGANSNVVQFVPSSSLSSTTYYYLYLTNVTNAQGLSLSNTWYTYFQTGMATNTTAPSVLSVGPPNNAIGVGVNASIIVTFNNPIDPVSINASTAQVSGGSQTVVPSSISFGRYFVASPNFDYVSITPQAPLPANTTMTIAINGVTDPESNAVTAQTTHFSTGAGPDLTAPNVVLYSWQPNDTVATNVSFSEEFNEPMDPGTVNSTTFLVYDATVGGTYLPATVTLSPDLKTETVTPNSPLTPGHQIYVYSQNAQDLAGNTQNSTFSYATVGSGTDTTPPVVLETNPPANFTGVPLNVPVQIEFSQEIAQASIGNVQLLQGGSPVAVTASFSRLSTVLTLTPSVPLLPNTTYTISIAGVTDTAGNVVATQAQSFTTGGTIKLNAPVNVLVTPCCNQTGVPDTTTIQIAFDSPMDSLTFDTAVGSAVLELTSTSAVVPTTVSFSLDYKTVILTPSAPLTPSTSYTVVVKYGQVTDMAGNVYFNSISQSFTAQ